MTDRTGDPPKCLNCGAPLAGQYCGQCGQRSTNRLISLWELTRDAFGDLFELDSRLWRTFVPLLIRPGLLTRDYLEGRRARYMPPFRMYLVLSLIFFVVAFFDPRQQLAILYEPVEPIEPALTQERREAQKQEVRAALEELVREGVVDEAVLDPDGPLGAGLAAADDVESREKPESGLSVNDNDTICVVGAGNFDFMPEIMQRRFSEKRLQEVCERVIAVGAGGVMSALLDNVPGALIILLPLMAIILKLLYPLSRRYYVEHLLFFIHFHAFLFLLLTLQILWARLIGLVGLADAMRIAPIVATSLYIPVYLYKSMRLVYGQGRASTVLKFLGLSITYTLGLILMMLGALLIAVFSV